MVTKELITSQSKFPFKLYTTTIKSNAPAFIAKEKYFSDTSVMERYKLQVDPFAFTDAEKDPNIPFFLVDHEIFPKIFNQDYSFIFAPQGGGKTAFRVRFSLQCRSGQLEPRTFSLNYNVPEPPNSMQEEEIEKYYLKSLLKQAAIQILLVLALHPEEFNRLTYISKNNIRSFFEFYMFSFSRELAELSSRGVESLFLKYDKTMLSLAGLPDQQDIINLCKVFSNIPIRNQRNVFHDYDNQFEWLQDIIFNILGYSILFILVDGVDGYPATEGKPSNGVQSIEWLLNNTLRWAEKKIFIKYFLPTEYFQELQFHFQNLLTNPSKIANIVWDADALEEVAKRRLWESSGKKFNSLVAISDRSIAGMDKTPEQLIVEKLITAEQGIPRDVVVMFKQLFEYLHDKPKLIRKDFEEFLSTSNHFIEFL